MIETRNLSFQPEEHSRDILREITLQIHPGERIGILGASGSGKSTLGYHLCAIHKKALAGETRGQLLLQGRDCSQRDYPGFAGIVLQNPDRQLFCDSVTEELSLGPENQGRSPQAIVDCVEKQLCRMDLVEYRSKRIDTLSQGFRQRVCIASMLAVDPQILFLDEPTNYLDEDSATQLFQTMTELNEQQSMTILVVEHDRKRLLAWATRILILEEGALIYDGSPETLPPEWQVQDFQGESFRTPMVSLDASIQMKIENVSYRYDKSHWVLHDVSLTARTGEIIALTGKNGCGKTTLLKIIKGLYRPECGCVWIDGNDDRMSRVGLVFQNPDEQFFSHSVEKECGFALAKKGLSLHEKKERVDRMLETFGLSDKREQFPFTLSYGEKRRLAIASVLIGDPDFICLDEPTIGLDFRQLAELSQRMKEWAAQGKTLLFSSHDRDFVQHTASREVSL